MFKIIHQYKVNKKIKLLNIKIYIIYKPVKHERKYYSSILKLRSNKVGKVE